MNPHSPSVPLSACPMCKQVDLVGRVRTLVESDHGPIKLATMTRKQLFLPAKPLMPPTNRSFMESLVLLWPFAGLLVWLGDPLYGAVLFGIGLIFLGIAVAQKRRLAKRLTVWNAAKEKWGELYYCARDDVMYFPGNDAINPAKLAKTIGLEK